MKTPITDSATKRWSEGQSAQSTLIKTSQRLELDRVTLIEALEDMITEMGAFKRDLGVAFSLKKANDVLVDVRANFPQ